MSDEPLVDSSLFGAFTDPTLKTWDLDYNDILTEQELMVVGFVRKARQPVRVGWVMKATGLDEAFVRLSLEKLVTAGWVRQVEGLYIAL